MDERRELLEAQVAELAAEVRSLRARLDVVEASLGLTIRPGTREDITEEIAALAPKRATLIEVVTLSGRACVVLGVAYLLRALTDAGTFSQPVGLGLGVAFGGLWVAMAHRAASRKKDLSATFHVLAASAIGFPLVWEGTLRFGVLPHPLSAVLLTLFAAVGFGVAWHRDLRGLAWVLSLFAFVTGFGMLFRSHAPAAYAWHMLALAAGSLWLTYDKGWTGLRWVGAFVSLSLVALTTMLHLGPRRPEWMPQNLVIGVELAFFGVYVGWFAVRSLVFGRPIGVFEAVTSAALALVGFQGALTVAGEGWYAVFLGAVGILLGVGACIASLMVARRDGEPSATHWFYSTFGLVFVLGGVVQVLPAVWATAGLGAAMLACSALGPAPNRRWADAHSAAYGIGLLFVSGLFSQALRAFVGAPGAPDWGLDVVAAIALGTCGVATALHLRRPQAAGHDTFASLARLVFLGIVVLGMCAGSIGLLAVPAADAASPDGDAGVLAVLRTGALAFAAVALAWGGRTPSLREMGWMVYPLLAITGLKFLFQDVPQGRPATLFVSLVLLGTGLIAVPFLRRAEAPAPAD